MNEVSITRATIRRLLREFPGVYVRKIAGGPYQASGVPDLLVCYKGMFVGIEMKQPGRRPSRIQEVELGRIQSAGGVAGVATSTAEAVELVRSSIGDHGWHESHKNHREHGATT